MVRSVMTTFILRFLSWLFILRHPLRMILLTPFTLRCFNSDKSDDETSSWDSSDDFSYQDILSRWLRWSCWLLNAQEPSPIELTDCLHHLIQYHTWIIKNQGVLWSGWSSLGCSFLSHNSFSATWDSSATERYWKMIQELTCSFHNHSQLT
jgi:hypothetical protein